MEKQRQKSPSTIDLLSTKECQELEVDGEVSVFPLFVPFIIRDLFEVTERKWIKC